MNELNHWHPVLPTNKLKRKPVAVKLCGQELVLFRSADGHIGALKDLCPHRRMRLSAGFVDGERLVCPYHGWSFACDGAGHSPATPKLQPRAKSFDVEERYGWIWLKSAASDALLPQLDFPGFHQACTLEHHFEAPLELALDIFAEMEHAPTSHTFFGYSLAQSEQTEAHFDFSDQQQIRLLSITAQRPLPWLVQKLFGVNSGDRFYNQLTMHFSPVYSTYEMHWVDTKTGQTRAERLLSVFFFNPLDAGNTQCISMHYLKSPRWGKTVFHLLQKHVLKAILNHEVKRDQWVLEHLADQSTDVSGMCFGRFDKILLEHRKRLRHIYRQASDNNAAPAIAQQHQPSFSKTG